MDSEWNRLGGVGGEHSPPPCSFLCFLGPSLEFCRQSDPQNSSSDNIFRIHSIVSFKVDDYSDFLKNFPDFEPPSVSFCHARFVCHLESFRNISFTSSLSKQGKLIS